MIVFSIISYVILAVWYLMGKSGSQKISMIISILLSSFFAFWYWEINNIGMIIYFLMGIISIFFYWIAFDSTTKTSKNRNKLLAGCLSLFLGGYGIHKFYLKRNVLGALYLLFFWTCVPFILGILDAFVLFFMSKNTFDKKYNAITSQPTNKQLNKQQSHQSDQFDFSKFLDDSGNEYAQFSSASKNSRKGDNLNYTDIRLCGCQAKAVGTVEDFVITVYKNGRTYTFKSKDGDICSSRSTEMRAAKKYEVM